MSGPLMLKGLSSEEERRGLLTYKIGSYDNTFYGWLRLTNRDVTARKIGGRRMWLICPAYAVKSFREGPYTVKGRSN